MYVPLKQHLKIYIMPALTTLLSYVSSKKSLGGQKAQPSKFRIMVAIKGQDVLAADERGGADKWIEMPNT